MGYDTYAASKLEKLENRCALHKIKLSLHMNFTNRLTKISDS